MGDEHSGIIEMAKSFCERDLRPRWEKLDALSDDVLGELLRVLAGIGFYSIVIDESTGGSGQSIADCAVMIEEVSRVCPSLGVIMASHVMGTEIVSGAGDETRQKILCEIVSREGCSEAPLMALCWMEDVVRLGAGMGLDAMDATLTADGNSYLLKGRKLYVPAASLASYMVVPAQMGDGYYSWVVVPRDATGVELSAPVELMGLRLCPFNHVTLNDVRVPGVNVLVRNLQPRDMLKALLRYDACLGAVGVGMAREAFEKSARYAVERYQGGKMISDHDAIRTMLADMAMGIESARAQMIVAADKADSGRATSADMLCSSACADSAVRAATDGVQIHGGYGYMRDYGIERILRDAKTFQTTVVLPQCRKMEFVSHEVARLK